MVCKYFLFMLVFLTTCIHIFAWTDCGSVDGSIAKVQVSNCSQNARRCILKRGSNATMTIDFKPKVDSDSVKAVVHGIIMGVPVPFDLPNSDGCLNSGIKCPIKADGEYKYFTNMPILNEYPRVTVDIKWELQDSIGKNLICALIPAKLQ
ncbi:NPC intracellular cholesterol transporter 2 homolog a-like [Anthonomus grandis grandis]|uniref:NPC intracellular cholesterol transporter 2 homolog a-like n=1 Tax=Anthonomus grandis grandis TaxID=2921223 RepID=UPI002164F110|nr:NPC intracellular cholesterol transporter 2 homolog a-like [Anthonomus grandis grandis]